MTVAHVAETAMQASGQIAPLVLTAADAGRILGVSAKTMSNWRALGKGPRYVRYTTDEDAAKATVRYRYEDLVAYVDSCVMSA